VTLLHLPGPSPVARSGSADRKTTVVRPPLRVALDATPLLGPRTGVGVFTAELLDALATRSDLSLTAWAATWRGRGQLASELPAGVRAVERPMAARPLRTMWARTEHPAIERWTGAVDVVHGTNYVVPPTRRAAALVSVHDLTVVRFPELCTADTLAYPDLLRRAFERGAHVHTDSRFVAGEVMETFGLPADRVHAVHLGVTPLLAARAGEGRELAGADRYVLALGTVEPRKDIPSLVAAFDRLADDDRDAHLVIAGPDGWGASALAAALERARHGGRINRLDRFVTEHERAALVRDAMVLAYPSRYEGFGLPPLEAMQVGVPVVATRAGSLPEVLGDAAEWCAVGDTDALVAALHRLLHDDERRAELAVLGPEQAARYSWAACADGLEALYRQLAG
jgi:glycosyltransferase involved in cell wall biosynthesis